MRDRTLSCNNSDRIEMTQCLQAMTKKSNWFCSSAPMSVWKDGETLHRSGGSFSKRAREAEAIGYRDQSAAMDAGAGGEKTWLVLRG